MTALVFSASYKQNIMKKLEDEAERKLSLPRITDTDAQEAAEIEERRGTQRIEIVGVVEGIEHLDARNKRELAVVELEGTSHTEVEHEEGIVFAKMVAAAIDAVDEARK